MDPADGECERWADAMGAEQRFEHHPLIRGDEPIQGLGVLTAMVMRMEHDLRTRFAEIGRGRCRDNDAVSDAGNLDEHLARSPTLEQNAAHRADHVRTVAATAARIGAIAT